MVHTATGDTVRLRMVHSDAYPNWESVYQDNIDRLYRLMYSKVGNRSDVEDLTSEVFKNALGPLRMASSKGEVRSYYVPLHRLSLPHTGGALLVCRLPPSTQTQSSTH